MTQSPMSTKYDKRSQSVHQTQNSWIYAPDIPCLQSLFLNFIIPIVILYSYIKKKKEKLWTIVSSIAGSDIY